MVMKSNAARTQFEERTSDGQKSGANVDNPAQRFGPIAVLDPSHRPLRMYTEDEVSQMLQVSLSQLRKWRMKGSRGSAQGPPFKKIGRLVRYPEQALLGYINSR